MKTNSITSTKTTSAVMRVPRPVRRPKMYKDKKLWVTALVFGTAVSTIAISNTGTVHADVATGAAPMGGSQQAATGGNAVTQTTVKPVAATPAPQAAPAPTAAPAAPAPQASAPVIPVKDPVAPTQAAPAATTPQTQQVTVDHSNVDQAVANAKKNGLEVHSEAPTNQTVSHDQGSAAANSIAADYAKQAQTINSQVAQHQHDKANYDSIMSAPQGDTTALDAAVKEAQGLGVQVTKGSEQDTQLDPANDNQINKWKTDTAADYQKQLQDLQNAIATQKQYNDAWAKYQAELDAWKKQHSGETNADVLSTAEIQQQLELGREPQAKVTVSQLAGKASRIDASHGNGSDSTSYEYDFDGSVSGTAMVATYTNLQHSYYVDSDGQKHTIAKIVRTFSNLTQQPNIPAWAWDTNPKNNRNPLLWIYDDPTDGFWYQYSSGVTVTDQYYDEQGNLITLGKNAWLAVTSLNNHGGEDHGGDSDVNIEKVSVVSGGEAKALLGSSVTNHDGVLYSDKNNSVGPEKDVNWDQKGPLEYWGAGLIKLSGSSIALRFSTYYSSTTSDQLAPNAWATMTTIIPATPGPQFKGPTPPGPISYHYDVAKILPGLLTPPILDYQYHNLDILPTPAKHWDNGSATVDGKVYVNGDNAQAKVTTNLQGLQNYTGGLKSLTLTDDYSQFANDVTYQSATITENGKDVTSQYKITNENGKVTAVRNSVNDAPDGDYVITAHFKVNQGVAAGTKLVNNGSVTINSDVTPAPSVTTTTFTPTDDKNWVEDNTVVNGKIYIDGDTAHALIESDLPDASQLANPLSKVDLDDNYTQFAKYVTTTKDNVRILENGQDATSQYDIEVKDGHVTATRKDAASTPTGKVQMYVDFQIKSGTPSGTQLTNAGSITINTDTVPTKTPSVETYEPNADKHWTEGGQVVDNKVYLDGDTVQANIAMTLPDPAKLAKPLSNVTLTDNYTNFKDLVDYQSAKVLENGQDVTSQYNINTTVPGIITVTRKDASKAPAGVVTLVPTFKIHSDVKNNTPLVNSATGTINTETVKTPDRTITVFRQDDDKNWLEGNTKVNGKIYVAGDTAHAQLTTTLPDANKLAKQLSNVTITDDYSNFAKYADVTAKDVHVVENGQDVTGQYTVTIKDGKITATRKDPSKTPMGIAQMNVDFHIKSGTPSGTKFVNAGSVTLNSSTVPTKTPDIVTFEPNADKHWTEGTQVVDGKVYVAGDTVHADVTMTLPDSQNLAKQLTKTSVTDDFSKFKDLVDYQSATVLENGKDVTNEYNIVVKDGIATATRKDASKTPGGSVDLHLTFKIHSDVKSGTQLVNSGSGTINNETVKTPDRIITTYKTDANKHWTLDGNVTDNQVYLDGTTATATITVNGPANLATALSKVVVDDNYSQFADKADVDSTKVLENGKDVTSEYDIKTANGHVTATRKDASKTPDGAKIQLVTTFKIHQGLDAQTVLTNSGSATINTDTEKVPDTSIVTYKPNPKKDVGLGDQVGKVTNSVDGKTVAKGTTATYGLTTDDLPANRAQKITSRSIEDNLDAKLQYNGFKAWVTGADGKLEDVTSHIKLTKDGQKLTFTEDDYLLKRYNTDLTKAVSTPIIDLFVTLTGDGSDVKNTYDLYTNGVKDGSNTVENKTPEAPKPTKVDHNEQGVDINGKTVLPGSTNVYNVTADYDQYKGIEASDASVKKGFYIIDDYPEAALDVDTSKFTAKDSQGKDVKMDYKVYKSVADAPQAIQDAIKAMGAKIDGAFIVASPSDPAAYFKDYIQTGDSVTVTMPMVVKDAFDGSYKNQAYEFDFGNGYATNPVTNNVPKIDPKKDVVVSVDNQKSMNGANIAMGDNFDYKLGGALLPANEGNPITQYGFEDDYDQEHDQYNGQYTVMLDTDVTLTDGTVLKKGTDVTKYTTQQIATAKGAVDIEFDKDFLAKVDMDKSAFGATVYLNMTRIKDGDVTNTYVNVINGKKYKSNTVKTHTDKPQPKTPATPEKPATPAQPGTPATPAPAPAPAATPAPAPAPQPVAAVATPATPAPQQALPQTGDANDNLAVLGLAALGLVGTMAIGLRKKRFGD